MASTQDKSPICMLDETPCRCELLEYSTLCRCGHAPLCFNLGPNGFSRPGGLREEGKLEEQTGTSTVFAISNGDRNRANEKQL